MKEQEIFDNINENKKIKADLLAIFDEIKVYLVGDRSINNLKSAILEALIFIGEYAIDKCNYRTLDVATTIVEPVVSHYKRYIDLEYEKYKNNPEWLERQKIEDGDANYKAKFVLAILEEKTMIQGNISMSDFDLFLDKLFEQVRYSLFRDHSFNDKQVNIFLDEIIRLAFNILSSHYAEESMKRIDYFLEHINEIEENIPEGNKKIYIDPSNKDNYVIGVFKDGKLVEGTKDVLDFCTGQLYELEVKNCKETGKGKRITAEGVMFCGEVKGEKCKGRIIYPNGDVYIGELRSNIKNGQGRFISNYEEIIEGNFIEENVDGKAKVYCKNYTCYYNFKNGRMSDGIGKIFFKNGRIYECDFKDCQPVGKIKVFYPNGDIYELETFEDKNGNFIENKKTKYIEQENWCENFVKIPKQKENYLSIKGNDEEMENICIGKVRNDNREESVIIFKNGDIYMGQTKDNKKEGHGRIIYNNGEIYVGDFKDDKRDGMGLFVDLDGDIYMEQQKKMVLWI